MESPQDDRPHRIPDAEGQELFRALQRALASGRPLDLLVSVGSLLDSIDERNADPARALGPSLADLVLSFVDTPYAETTAALLVLRELHPVLPHADRVAAELGRRDDAVPGWLRELGRARAAGSTWTITEVGGDAVDHLAGVRLPDGSSLTTAVILDRATGGHVLDGVVLPLAVDDVVGQARSQAGDAIDVARLDADPWAASVTRAIDGGAAQDTPVVTATWPLCRPVVEWVVRLNATHDA
ncbi:hypothetical protein QE364_001640 [Nocardioides zeae]|uniref:Uncharacterized protein n=1 Tax=Nocardioides zeae TaxID=1457234 RepID=A0ACC6IH04_9ACTN|nr:hypothetical protein [Nocardioides zeae]MDR6172939.1 hypothetical protein [Nocardioides zeae]MDR6209933.1 hypothetical protein [Nocardioides zeae]